MVDKQLNDNMKQTRWLVRHGRLLLIASLVVIILLGGVLYSQRHVIHSLITGSHFVDGNAGVTNVHLPPGFQASVFFSGLASPRLIAFSPDGTLFVAERGAGSIVALPDPDHTGKATSKKVVISGLNDPTSLVFYDGALYVGEQSQISRFTLGPDLQVTSKKIIVPDLPTDGQHSTRTVLVGPDGKLYVSMGSTCNACVESDPHRAAIWVYNLDGSGGRLYARGLRNAVGMAINPWCHAGDIIDPDFGHPGDCNGVVQPLIKMQAHSAPLGLAFYNANQFPQQYHGLFVAFHGSWNRSVPTGYKVVFIPLNSTGQVTGPAEDFATGWLVSNDNAFGRPVGLAVGPDGALYVSDDKGGMIYRITYNRNH